MYSLTQLKGQTSKRGSLGQQLDLKGGNLKPLRGLEGGVTKEILEALVDVQEDDPSRDEYLLL